MVLAGKPWQRERFDYSFLETIHARSVPAAAIECCGSPLYMESEKYAISAVAPADACRDWSRGSPQRVRLMDPPA